MTAADSTAPLLAAEDLHLHFPTTRRGETVRAVDGVSFTVHSGETFGIIGKSGSGKSTLARALVCLARPSAGRILHHGADPFTLPARALRRHRRQFQIVFQESSSALDPRMNVGDSIREPMELAAEGDPVIRQRRMLDLLDRVGLSAATAGRYPHELWGRCQEKRVNIARALAQNPTLIVCDEVVAALDASIQADILNLFADLQSQFGLTYVFITHDLGVVAHVSTRIAVMYLGRIVELGPAGPVTEAPLHPYTHALLAAEPVALPAALRPAKRLRLQARCRARSPHPQAAISAPAARMPMPVVRRKPRHCASSPTSVLSPATTSPKCRLRTALRQPWRHHNQTNNPEEPLCFCNADPCWEVSPPAPRPVRWAVPGPRWRHPQKGGTLNVSAFSDVTSFDPATGRSGDDHIVLYTIYDTLIDYDFDTLRAVPNLATAWSFPDPKTLVLQLRPDVQFQDGTPFDGAAVKFNLDRIRQLPRSTIRADVGSLDTVEVVSPTEVHLHLKQPDTGACR